jgi:hypothetical protein
VLEILVVVALMTLSVFLMAPEFSKMSDDRRTEQTLLSMEEIRKAVLGTPSPRVGEPSGLAGYLPDVGALPALVDGQPLGLWRNDLDGDNEPDLLPHHTYFASFSTSRASDGGAGYGISLGWRGPYLKRPQGDVLRDAWDTPLGFSLEAGDLVVRSLGADGAPGGEGTARDLELRIRDRDCRAVVAGYISPHAIYGSREDARAVGKDFTGDTAVRVRVYYGPNPAYAGTHKTNWGVSDGGLLFRETAAAADGYFRFDKENRIPVGQSRILAVVQGGLSANGREIEIFHPYKLAVRPGITWLGRMGSIP